LDYFDNDRFDLDGSKKNCQALVWDDSRQQRKGVLQDVNGIDNSNLGADNVHKMIFTKKSLRNPLVKEKNYRV
jgi:hypothetical protein